MNRFEKTLLLFYLICFVLFAFIIFYPAGKARAGGEQTPVCGVRVTENGLIETLFDIDGDGRADWVTLSRRTRDQKKNEHPLFFGYVPGPKEGLWRFVYIDRAEDGLNGNEELYFEGRE